MSTPVRHAPLKVGLAGLGTVGSGVIRLIEENAALIARRAGREIKIVAITARDRTKDRGVDLSPYRWVDDMGALATADDIDVVVELVGGADGPALTLARETLSNGRALVTANKAMIAHHGFELAALAESKRAALKFEAAVAGGIPVIQGLRDGAAAAISSDEVRGGAGLERGAAGGGGTWSSERECAERRDERHGTRRAF